MRNNKSQGSSRPLSSVTNALRVLTLAQERGIVTLPLISEELGVAKSTAHRLVSTLLHEQFLQQSSLRKSEYILGPIVEEIGVAALRRTEIQRHARRHMERLSLHLNETISLVVREGNASRVVESVESHAMIRVHVSPGVVLPLNATAAGKVLMAYLPDEELAELFPQGLPSVTGMTLGDWPELKKQLQEIREAGHAFSASESETGLHGLAVPVFDRAGGIIAALALLAPYFRLAPRTAPARARVLRETAQVLTRALG